MKVDEVNNQIAAVDEAAMNPSSFAAAIEQGGEVGVLVGYEFEVCVPESAYTKLIKTKDENYYKKYIDYIFGVDGGGMAVDPEEWGFTKDSDSNYTIPTTKMDEILKVNPKAKYTYFPNFTEAAKHLLKKKDDDSVQKDYASLLELMFKRNYTVVLNNLDKFFEYDPEKLYKSLYSKGIVDDVTEEDVFYSDEFYDEDNPYYQMAADYVKPKLEQTMGVPVHIFQEYHQARKNLTDWYIEPDGSIEPDDGDAGVEIVSPPMLATKAMTALKDFYALAKKNKFYTSADNKTGLHINVSIPSKIDILKLAIFTGDQYALKTFGREDNEYARSVINDLRGISDTSSIYKNISAKGKKQQKPTQFDFRKLNSIIRDISDEHTASISNNGKYISFRQAGGNYLNNYQNVVNIVGRFVQAMIIASDPNLYRDEYLTKLVKLFGSPATKSVDQRGPALDLLKKIRSSGLPVIQLNIYSKNETLFNSEATLKSRLTNFIRNELDTAAVNAVTFANAPIILNSRVAKQNVIASASKSSYIYNEYPDQDYEYGDYKKTEDFFLPLIKKEKLNHFAQATLYPNVKLFSFSVKDINLSISELLNIDKIFGEVPSPIPAGVSLVDYRVNYLPMTDAYTKQFITYLFNYIKTKAKPATKSESAILEGISREIE